MLVPAVSLRGTTLWAPRMLKRVEFLSFRCSSVPRVSVLYSFPTVSTLALSDATSNVPEPGISVWVVEDNDLLRETIVDLIRQTPDIRCTFAAGSSEEAIAALEDDLVPQVVLMDLGLPGMSGQEGTRCIKAFSPTTHVIVLTVHEDDDQIFEAICAGASGYLLKPASGRKIVKAIESVLQGGAPMNARIARKVLAMFTLFARPKADYGLTDREREILHHLVDGYTQKQIAERLFVSPHTVDTHLRNIYAKLHVHSRSDAVVKALKERLIKGL